MLESSIINRSNFPWSSPIVIVGKKDGSKRFCVDFRALNKVTKVNSWPLPRIEESLALLGGSKYFTALDCRSGYFQVKVDPKDREKTAFCCHRGLFEFNVLPFGLCNGPSVYMELMSHVLQGFETFAIAYIDDILVFSPTKESHLVHVQLVFDRLRVHNLKLKMKICSFMQTKTNYLDFLLVIKA